MGLGAERRSKRGRLSRSADFERVYREGRSHASRHLVVYSFPREQQQGETRVGVSVGRKVGGAVERNRVKRLLREGFAAIEDDLPPGHDFVLVARADIGELATKDGRAGVEEELRQLIEKTGLAAAGSKG